MNPWLEILSLVLSAIIVIGCGIWLIIKIDDKFHINKWHVTIIGLLILAILSVLVYWLNNLLDIMFK